MAWYPDAVGRQLTTPRRAAPNSPVLMPSPRRINLHTAVSNSLTLAWYMKGSTRVDGYFNMAAAGGVFSHFYIRKDGTVEQMQDTKFTSACDLDGNPDTISIESWDGREMVAWNLAQVAALEKLLRWLFAAHPTIPRKLATSNLRGPQSHGLSYHQLGSPGLARYTRAQGGLLYTTAYGKVCPGRPRISQIPSLFAAAIGSGLPTVSTPSPGVPDTGVDNSGGLTMSDITAILARLDALEGKVDYVQKQAFDIADKAAKQHAATSAQIRDFAVKSIGREALDQRNAELRTVINGELEAKTSTILDALADATSEGLLTEDGQRELTEIVQRALADARATVTIDLGGQS